MRNIYFSVLLTWLVVIVLGRYNDMLGCGKWNILSISSCPGNELYTIKLQPGKKKLNHTHDSFYGEIDFDVILDNSMGLYLDLYMEVDGGSYKLHSTMKEECFCCTVKKYAEEDMEQALNMMGVDPPDCPVQTGHYELSNFIFNYGKLKAKRLMYGRFKAFVYMTTGVEDDMKKIGCLQCHFEYIKVDDQTC